MTPDAFQTAFGAPMEQAEALLATKTLTISKLMLLVPPGTPNPLPHLYDTSMYAYAGLMTTAVVAHALVRPLNTPTPPAPAQVIEVVPTAPAEVKDEVVGDRQVNK